MHFLEAFRCCFRFCFHFRLPFFCFAASVTRRAFLLCFSWRAGTNLLEAARLNEAKRYFYASTACVYNEDLQLDPSNPGLKETDAWPAKPQVKVRPFRPEKLPS